MNIYLKMIAPFMEADGGAGGRTPAAESAENPPAASDTQSFDDVLKNKAFQAEFDRRMNRGIQDALAKEKARLETLADERISEAEKLSKMTELERKEYEQKKLASEIERREKDINRRELMAEAKNTLTEKSLPLSLAEILDYSDAEKCSSSLEMIGKAFNEAVKIGVEERLKGDKPPKAPQNNNSSMELEEQIFQHMKGR